MSESTSDRAARQSRVAVEPRIHILRLLVEGELEQLPDISSVRPVSSFSRNSRNSQARASAHRRFKVAGDIPSASPASSMASSAKYGVPRSLPPPHDRFEPRKSSSSAGSIASSLAPPTIGQRHSIHPPPSLLSASRSCAIHEDLPHRPCGDAQEMVTVGPGCPHNKPQYASWTSAWPATSARPFAPHIARRQPPKLVIGRPHEVVGPSLESRSPRRWPPL